MCRSVLIGAIVLAMLAAAGTPVEAASPLTADVMRATLRTGSPDEEAYITYIATLLEQGRLPRDMVEGIFQWARGKPYPKRVQYFKRGLITKAAEIGIVLPQGTPALTGTIKGHVFTRVLLAKVPAPDVTVTIDGTDRSAVTNLKGEFTFHHVPLGTYTLRVGGITGFLSRAAAAKVMLPSRPPSLEPATVELEAK
jgi:hypothetical protein